jgi:hypothetical protein
MREIRQKLVEATAREVKGMPYYKAMQWAGADPSKLNLVARARGYHWKWVEHRLREIRQSAVA